MVEWGFRPELQSVEEQWGMNDQLFDLLGNDGEVYGPYRVTELQKLIKLAHIGAIRFPKAQLSPTHNTVNGIDRDTVRGRRK